jgi:hypothetical protein
MWLLVTSWACLIHPVAFGQTPEDLKVTRISHPPTAGGRLSSVAWDGRAWIAVGSRSTVLRSEDGVEWQAQSANAEVCFRSVTSGHGTLFGLTHCSTALISRTGGVDWESQNTPGLQIRSVAFGTGLFVAVGKAGTMLISSNATSWIPIATDSADSLLCVRYAAERFVAVGAFGAIWSSPDGRTWTRRESGTRQRLRGLTHGNGTWVAVGDHGTILCSRDEEHWTRINAGTDESLRSIAFGDDTFLAVGRNGCIVSSRDVCEWRGLRLDGANFYDVAYGSSRFVAVGDRDTIVLIDGMERMEEPLAYEFCNSAHAPSPGCNREVPGSSSLDRASEIGVSSDKTNAPAFPASLCLKIPNARRAGCP